MALPKPSKPLVSPSVAKPGTISPPQKPVKAPGP